VTPTAKGHPKPNYAHFERVIGKIPKFDLVMVCGVQARRTVERYINEIRSFGKPILFVPHPASRALTNLKCESIRREVEEVERDLDEC
jgi:hypothetical protein